MGHELTDELGAKARERIAHFLQRKVEKGQVTSDERESALDRLSLTTDLSELTGCDLVIEAIVEELDVKQELFSRLEGIVGPDAVLATNTSALSVTEIASAVTTPERVVGMHFFNPAPLMPLVEIVRAELSSDAAVEVAYGVAERLGKQPIRCHDTPGFAVNRILIPLLNDCIRVLDEARITPEDLDTAMTSGAGWPMGPCTLVDLVGIDERRLFPDLDGAAEPDLSVTPLDEPRLPDPILDTVEDHVALGLRLRPEISEARLRVERGGLDVVQTRNGLLPRLDLFLNLGKTGFADSFGGAFRNLDGSTFEATGGLRYVKGLGLLVDGRAQVSMNLTDLALTSLAQAYSAVEREAAKLGVAIDSSEIVGLVPEQALQGLRPREMKLIGLSPDRILENRLAAVIGREEFEP